VLFILIGICLDLGLGLGRLRSRPLALGGDLCTVLSVGDIALVAILGS